MGAPPVRAHPPIPPEVDATRERRGQRGSISAPAASPAAKRLRFSADADFDAKAASTSAPVCG